MTGNGHASVPADAPSVRGAVAGGAASGRPRAFAADYSLLPYPAMPVTFSQPQHLAALATLFGLDPPDVDRASVLELGCASAGNIIPLAARFPRASFRGIDLSQRHIDEGHKRIAELALENISLRQGDLTTLDLAGQRFDYVICHGVFSWVPRAARTPSSGSAPDLAPRDRDHKLQCIPAGTCGW